MKLYSMLNSIPNLTIILSSFNIIQQFWSHAFPILNIFFIFTSICFQALSTFSLPISLLAVLVPIARGNCLSLSQLLDQLGFVQLAQTAYLYCIYSFCFLYFLLKESLLKWHFIAILFISLLYLVHFSLPVTFEVLVIFFRLLFLMSSISTLYYFMHISFPVTSKPRNHLSSSFSLSLLPTFSG